MADQTFPCKDCGNPFVFTERDQEFFKQKGFQTPVRCKSCRAAKKSRNDQFRNN